MTHKQKCEALVSRVQAVKAPMDAERVKCWAEIEALESSIRDRVQALRQKVKDQHNKIRALDELMASIVAAKAMKGEMADKVLADLSAQVEAL